jgi:phage gpG-like protein
MSETANVKVTVTIENNLPEASKELEYALKQWANYAGGEMVNLTHREQPKNGGRGTPVDTGRLRNSMSYATSEDNRTVYVGTNVEYAPYVEEGARGRAGAHMLRNAVMDVQDDSEAFLRQVLEDNGIE